MLNYIIGEPSQTYIHVTLVFMIRRRRLRGRSGDRDGMVHSADVCVHHGIHGAPLLSKDWPARHLIKCQVYSKEAFETLGVHWILTAVGCVAVALVPVPILLKRQVQRWNALHSNHGLIP